MRQPQRPAVAMPRGAHPGTACHRRPPSRGAVVTRTAEYTAMCSPTAPVPADLRFQRKPLAVALFEPIHQPHATTPAQGIYQGK